MDKLFEASYEKRSIFTAEREFDHCMILNVLLLSFIMFFSASVLLREKGLLPHIVYILV
jgi:hypothetical protein